MTGMKREISTAKMLGLLVCGVVGCILMGGGDWLMIYGDTAYKGSLAWLTQGVSQIAPWRNGLAMLLAFPAVILYGIALLGIGAFYKNDVCRRRYLFLTAAGMTPWLCLHLFYIMILYLFAWMHSAGHEALAYEACEALFGQFVWLIPVAQVIMLVPFFYWFGTVVSGKTVLPRAMAVNNPLLIYVVLKMVTMFLPDTGARLAFVNGLMSESMIVFFLILAAARSHLKSAG